jgi:TDG/mug DNA glycosylase family protein
VALIAPTAICSHMSRFQVTSEELKLAVHRKVPDVIASNLKLLFVGINPGLYTAAVGYHFAHPGNRFWPALYAAKFTPRLLYPDESSTLLSLGFGITNLVDRPTKQASNLSKAELLAGSKILLSKVAQFKPRVISILGLTSFRQAFHQPQAKLRLQKLTIGEVPIWVLPNPSGLNAHFTPKKLAQEFSALHDYLLYRLS